MLRIRQAVVAATADTEKCSSSHGRHIEGRAISVEATIKAADVRAVEITVGRWWPRWPPQETSLLRAPTVVALLSESERPAIASPAGIAAARPATASAPPAASSAAWRTR